MSQLNAVLARNTEDAPICTMSSQTVAFSHYNHLSAQLPLDPKTGEIVSDCVKEQAKQCFKNIKAVVKSIDHVMSDVVRITIFVKNIKDMDKVEEVYKSFFKTYVPAKTVVAVDDLLMGAKVQVEAVITNGEGTIPNAPQSGDLIKLVNNTCDAPMSALSTQVVAFSHYNNISAQLPLDPKTNRLVIGGVKEQTTQCLRNIKTILESIDLPIDDVVKMNVFVTDLKDVEEMNEAYSTFLPDSAVARAVGYMPARTVVAVKALPMQALVQIEAVVSHGDGTPPQAIEDRHGIIIEANNTKDAPVSKYSSQTVAFSHYNNISAQLPVDVTTGEVVEGGIVAQTKQCLNHIKTIAESVEHSLDDVVKVNIFVKDLNDMASVDEAYATYFKENLPARRVVGVSELPLGALIQIDAVLGNAEGTPPLVK